MYTEEWRGRMKRAQILFLIGSSLLGISLSYAQTGTQPSLTGVGRSNTNGITKGVAPRGNDGFTLSDNSMTVLMWRSEEVGSKSQNYGPLGKKLMTRPKPKTWSEDANAVLLGMGIKPGSFGGVLIGATSSGDNAADFACRPRPCASDPTKTCLTCQGIEAPN